MLADEIVKFCASLKREELHEEEVDALRSVMNQVT